MTKGSLKALVRNFLPRQVRTHTILGGPLRGRKMVTSWRRNFSGLVGWTEPGVNQWFAENVKAGETWLDVGANYGVTALRLADLVGSSGRVYAFEPKLETCGYLASTVSLNAMGQVLILPVALGATEDLGVRRFITSGSMVVGAACADGPAEAVFVTRFDWLWPRIAEENLRVDGIKIDVQGMEFEVLSGMTELLSTYKPRLCIELHAGVDRKKLLDLLETCGYSRRGEIVDKHRDTGPEARYLDNANYAFAAVPGAQCAKTSYKAAGAP